MRAWLLVLVVVSMLLAGCLGGDAPDQAADENSPDGDAPDQAADEYSNFSDTEEAMLLSIRDQPEIEAFLSDYPDAEKTVLAASGDMIGTVPADGCGEITASYRKIMFFTDYASVTAWYDSAAEETSCVLKDNFGTCDMGDLSITESAVTPGSLAVTVQNTGLRRFEDPVKVTLRVDGEVDTRYVNISFSDATTICKTVSPDADIGSINVTSEECPSVTDTADARYVRENSCTQQTGER